MSDEDNSREIFVIPQRRAAKQFKEVTSKRKIDGISLESISGGQLANLPIQVNLNKVVPRVFQAPMRAGMTAGMTATSVLARVFQMKIVFGLKEDES